MKTVKVNKAGLLDKLKENMATHVEEYDLAVIGYRAYAKELYAKAINELADTQQVTTYFDLNDSPTSHESEYKRAIAMLEMDIDELVELSTGEFDQYVLDNWNWKDAFRVSNTKYGL